MKYFLTVSLLIVQVVFLSLSAFPQSITQTGSLITARTSHQSQLLPDGKVIVFGGDNSNINNKVVFNTAEIYDPATGEWTSRASMNQRRTNFASVLLKNGKILCIGGEDASSAAIASCELYDPVLDTWTYTGSLKNSRKQVNAVLLQDGKVLIASGCNDNTSEIYNPDTGVWTLSGNLKETRYFGSSLVLLQNGQVLITGGATYESMNAEVFDPVTGIWRYLKNPMKKRMMYHSSVLLNDGKVLITGSDVSSNELYDPMTESFSYTGALSEARYGCTPIKMDNGNVLIFGLGDIYNPSNSKCIEVYDPFTETWSSGKYNFTGSEYYTINRLPNGLFLIAGGTYTMTVTASPYCFLVAQEPSSSCTSIDISKSVIGNSFCSYDSAKVLISGSEAGVTYKAFYNGKSISVPVQGIGNIQLSIPPGILIPGNNSISVKAGRSGCIPVEMTAKANINVHLPVRPSITIGISSGSNPSKLGAPVTYTAQAQNQGSTPVYIWKINDKSYPSSSSSFTTTNLKDQDVVTCLLVSGMSCIDMDTVSADTIRMTIITPIPPKVVSTVPLNISSNSPTDIIPQIHFSDTMNGITASDSSIKFYGSYTGLMSKKNGSSYSGFNSSTVNFKHPDFYPGELITGIVSLRARNQENTHLAKPYIYSFRTKAGKASANFTTRAYTRTRRIWGIYAADFNSDGLMDLVCSEDYGYTKIYLNSGGGIFSPGASISSSGEFVYPYAADFDMDGDMDIAVANYSDNRIEFATNDGKGGLSNAYDYPYDNPSCVTGGDVDGDGDVDLIVGSAENFFTVFINDGKGVFPYDATSHTTTYSAPYSSKNIEVADLDGDGDLDLAVAIISEKKVMIYKNNGSGNFTSSGFMPLNGEVRSVFAADLDNDLDVDLAASNYFGTGIITIGKNDGTGNFSDTSNFMMNQQAWRITGADLDGDGDIDLATGNEGYTCLTVALNNGSGKFTVKNYSFSEGAGARGIAMADFDGDSDIDIALSNYWEGLAWVHYNDGTSPAISRPSTSAASYCPGFNFYLPFGKAGTFNNDNSFIAQISDASGSFSNPLTIGILNGAEAGEINCQIPAGMKEGTGYRIRIVSTSPEVIGPVINHDVQMFVQRPDPVAEIIGNEVTCEAVESYRIVNYPNVMNAWSATGASIQDASDSTITVGLYGPGPHIIKVTPWNSCGPGSSTTLEIFMKQAPEAPEAIAGATQVCTGNLLNYYVNKLDNVGHTWSLSPGSLPSPQGDTCHFSLPEEGNYLLTVTPSNECGTGLSKSITINANSVPKPTITANGNILSTDVTGVKYEWFLNHVPISVSTQFFEASEEGEYMVVVSDENNHCASTSDSFIFSLASIKRFEQKNSLIKVFPNPTPGKVAVSLKLPESSMKVYLFNGQGKRLSEETWMKNSMDDTMDIDFSAYGKGIYFLQVLAGEQTFSQMVIVE